MPSVDQFQPQSFPVTRRSAMTQMATTALAGWGFSRLRESPSAFADVPTSGKIRVAAIFTEFTYRSHAHVILENFLEPYLFRGELVTPAMEVVSLWGDQFPENEMARGVSRDYHIPICDTIDEALTLGGNELACDAVLSIGEHGKYPFNEIGQHMYPRKEFFDQIVATMRRCNRAVPLFSDKHLSYRWDWAKEMYDTARQLHIPFMAGSSVPLAHRKPQFELPEECEFEELLLVHGGGPDSYDFHALEVLQSLVESRRGGETGVESAQCLLGEAVWRAAEQGAWNPELVEVALRPELGDAARGWRETAPDPYLILVRYKDGLTAPLITVPGNRWAFACRLKGEAEPRGCQFHVGPWDNRNLFKALSHAIQHMFRTGTPAYPVERTLMTTGITEAVMRSRHADGAVHPTPHLNFGYAATDFKPFREDGSSWEILTYDVPQPAGIDPLGGVLAK